MRLILLSVFLSVTVFAQQQSDGLFRIEQERKVSHDINDEQFVTYTVFGRDNQKIYSLTREVSYDAAFPSVGVFDSGKLIIIDSFNGTAEFYNTDGSLLESLSLPGVDDVEHERRIDFSFHRNRVAILISEPGINYIRLAVYDEEGNLSVNENIDAQHGTGVLYSPDGSLLAIGTYSWVGKSVDYRSYFITNQGQVAGTIEAGFEKGSFSGDGTVFIGYSNSRAYLVDAREVEILWAHRANDEKIIIDAMLAPEGVVILFSSKPSFYEGKWIYKNPAVKTLDKNAGVVISVQEFPDMKFTTGTIRREDDQITLLLDTSIYPIEK